MVEYTGVVGTEERDNTFVLVECLSRYAKDLRFSLILFLCICLGLGACAASLI